MRTSANGWPASRGPTLPRSHDAASVNGTSVIGRVPPVAAPRRLAVPYEPDRAAHGGDRLTLTRVEPPAESATSIAAVVVVRREEIDDDAASRTPRACVSSSRSPSRRTPHSRTSSSGAGVGECERRRHVACRGGRARESPVSSNTPRPTAMHPRLPVADDEARRRRRVVVLEQLEEEAEPAAAALRGLAGEALEAVGVDRALAAVRADEDRHDSRS